MGVGWGGGGVGGTVVAMPVFLVELFGELEI